MNEQQQSRMETEEARKLSAIFQHSQDGIIIIDSRGIIESINPAAAVLFGYTPDEVIQKNVNMLMPEPNHSAHDGYIHNYLATGIKKIIGIGREVTGKKKDGSVFPFFLSVSEVQLEDRIIFTGFIHDISDLKAKELELEASKNRLNAIFETAVDGIIIIDEQAIIQNVNPAISRLFGYSKEELLGRNIKFLMPEPHHSVHDQYIDNYRKGGTAKVIGIGREVLGKRKDGTIFPFKLGVSEVKIQDRVIYTGIIHDLTSAKKKEQEIHELNQLLEQKVTDRTNELFETVNRLLSTNKKLEFEIAERKKVEEALRKSELETLQALQKEKELGELKSRFVSMASHEFRTPLSTILSSASLISRYEASSQQEKREKHINRIKSAVNNLTGILNDFLSLSRLEEGKINYHPEMFYLHTLIQEVEDEVQGILKKGQLVKYENLLEEMEVYLDRRLMKNVLINLLSNAIKYSPENKTIFVNTKTDNDQLIIMVRDQGIGIPMSDQKYLFSRFFRATNVTNIQGTGLGLNIVKKYIEIMKGSISFESKEGKGTSFTISLPKSPMKNE